MDGQTRTGVQLFVANVTLKVFGLLVLNENLLVIELTIAIPVRTDINQYKQLFETLRGQTNTTALTASSSYVPLGLSYRFSFKSDLNSIKNK